MSENYVVKRGEIYMASFHDYNTVGNEQSGTRPVLILQNNIGNRFGTTTIVALLTTKIKKDIPTHVFLEDIKSDVLLEQIRTISKLRLLHKIGEIKEEDLTEINMKLAFSLGLINLQKQD